jgi:hypothetical protein
VGGIRSFFLSGSEWIPSITTEGAKGERNDDKVHERERGIRQTPQFDSRSRGGGKHAKSENNNPPSCPVVDRIEDTRTRKKMGDPPFCKRMVVGKLHG